nr:hypothetical protein [Promineifilum sp.]
ARDWLHAIIDEQLRIYFYQNPVVRGMLADVEEAVMAGDLPATAAARQLLALLDAGRAPG